MSGLNMNTAYRAAGEMMDEKASASEKDLLSELTDSDVIVIRGQYDRVQDVLDITGMPYTLLDPEATRTLELDPSSQMLIVNCPGNLPQQADGLEPQGRFRKGSILLFRTRAVLH